MSRDIVVAGVIGVFLVAVEEGVGCVGDMLARRGDGASECSGAAGVCDGCGGGC